jgi:hypothetical protein
MRRATTWWRIKFFGRRFLWGSQKHRPHATVPERNGRCRPPCNPWRAVGRSGESLTPDGASADAVARHWPAKKGPAHRHRASHRIKAELRGSQVRLHKRRRRGRFLWAGTEEGPALMHRASHIADATTLSPPCNSGMTVATAGGSTWRAEAAQQKARCVSTGLVHKRVTYRAPAPDGHCEGTERAVRNRGRPEF